MHTKTDTFNDKKTKQFLASSPKYLQTHVLAALLSAVSQIGAACPLNILIPSPGKVIDSSDSWAPFTLQMHGQPHTQHTQDNLTAERRKQERKGEGETAEEKESRFFIY